MLYVHTGIEPGQLTGQQPNFPRSTTTKESNPDHQIQGLLCFSHLRWDFVFQRPQHLMTRASEYWPVYFWEEPIDAEQEELRIFQVDKQIIVLRPHISFKRSADEREDIQREWLNEWLLNLLMPISPSKILRIRQSFLNHELALVA